MDYFHEIANKHIKRLHDLEALKAMEQKMVNLKPYGRFYLHRVQNGKDGYYEIYDSKKCFIENCDDGELQSTIRLLEERGA